MKKVKFLKFTMAFFACVLAVAMGSCDKNDDPKVPDLKCTPSKVEVAPGKTATVTVSGGTAPFTVTSSNTKIATAKADKNTITITGLKDGTATMLISDSKKLTGKIPVVVKAAASGLDFDKKSVSVTVGKEEAVTVKDGSAPYTATAKDTKIATATVKDGKIIIKGVKAGSTSVTVTDKNKKTGTISVTGK